jgi:hypothetical protein
MSNLKILPEKAIILLNERIDDIKRMRETKQGFEYYDFIGRCSKIWSVIDEIYAADDSHPEDIRSIGLPTCSCNSTREVQIMLLDGYHSRLQDYINEIQRSVKISGLKE